MKKTSTKKTAVAAVAAAAGAILLLGGAGTLAYWTDTETSAAQTISSGTLDLGTIADSGNWTIKHVADGKETTDAAFTGPIVPGDVLTTTVDVPVTLAGQNIKATLAIGDPTITGDQALADALEVDIVSVDGAAGDTKTFTGATSGTVPVVVQVTFPWGAEAEYNDVTELKSLQFAAEYTLTQEPAGV